MNIGTRIKRKIQFLLKKRYNNPELLKKISQVHPIRLHLGCGTNNLDGWINIDVTDNSLADVVMDFKNIKGVFQPQSVREILMVHSISYLRLWEARDFFADTFSLLEPTGRLVLEFPDVVKCATAITRKEIPVEEYLEAVRAFYAFDLDEIRQKKPYTPYAFGWSAWHISQELKNVGFSDVAIKDPDTHNRRIWRDTRIEAIK
jgi:hypothetical protein